MSDGGLRASHGSKTAGTAAGERFSTSGDWTVADEIEMLVDRWSDQPAFLFEGRVISFRAMEARINRYAHWARAQGLRHGDVVALFMQNRPEFVFAWLGLTKVSVTTALINSQLTGAALAHCVSIAKARVGIVGAELQESWFAALPPAAGVQTWLVGDDEPLTSPPDGAASLDAALAAQPDARMPAAIARDGLSLHDPLLYVYTSGTTGLPKAVRMSGARILQYFINAAAGARVGERAYVVLPLYHGTGGFLGVGWGLEAGGGVVLRRKFSVSQFWNDVADHQATSFFYVGEICRYLVDAPPHPREHERRLDLVMGSGMREDVWHRFADRFKPGRIIEFYGGTEGAAGVSNTEGKIGSVGRTPPGTEPTLRLIRIDAETHEPLRRDGLCIETADDEPGEALGKMIEGNSKLFRGYAGNDDATEAKLLRDVFAPGDCWFRSGDLLRRDAEGYFYFLDRLGDTFRWKGENVATEEVARVMESAPGVAAAAVYGVKVPHRDGRAGMAAIKLHGKLDLQGISEAVTRLPPYARPLFLRVVDGFDATGTYKVRKTELMRQAFDAGEVSDPLYFLDPAEAHYVPLTDPLRAAIAAGQLRY